MFSWFITIMTAILIFYKLDNGASVELLILIGFVGSVLATIFDPIWDEIRDKKQID